MVTEIDKLPEDVLELKEIIYQYGSHINILEEQIRLLTDKLFGKKSEKLTHEDQLQLFNEPEEILESSPEPEIIVDSHSRKKCGRKPLAPELPRIDKIHDISEEEKVCKCGSMLSRIGEEVSERLDIVPAKIRVIRNIRYKYACKTCEGLESEGGAVKTASLPPQLIPQGIATPGLIAYILTSKFVDALPFYRQEKIFKRLGVELSRGTMAGWAIHVARKCEPLIELLNMEIRSGPLINIDETTVQVMNEPGRKNRQKSYMWIFRGGKPEAPALIYQYHSTRSGDVVQSYLSDYTGYVQTDGYSGYNGLEVNGAIVLVGCWAHARRKFVEVIDARPKKKKIGSAEIALNYIRRLYGIEKIANGLGQYEVYKLRQEKANIGGI